MTDLLTGLTEAQLIARDHAQQAEEWPVWVAVFLLVLLPVGWCASREWRKK